MEFVHEKKWENDFTHRLGIISLLAMSVSVTPFLNSAVQAQGQNQSSPSEMSQGAQQKLDELAQKFRGLGNSSGANLSLPQGGNLQEDCKHLLIHLSSKT